MKKIFLSFATIIVATLGSITPAFAYDANGNPEYGDPGFNPYEEMTPDELSQAQSQRVRDSMNVTLAEEGLPSTETMLTGGKLLLLLMVGAVIVKGVFFACVASNMSHTKSSSKKSVLHTTTTPAPTATNNVGGNNVPATAATTAAVHQQSNYDNMVAQTIEMMEKAERNDINSLNNTF